MQSAQPIRQLQISVDGVRSPVRECGPHDAREAVVFVHGNPGSGEDWVDLLPRIGAFARAVAPDMPGYGKSDRSRSFSYTVDGYARHLRGLLEALGIQRAHLVLHDFGGPWGLAWGCEHPDSVASLTLIDTGVFPGYRWHKFARIWRTPILGEILQLIGTRRSMGVILDRDNPRPLPPAFVDRMFRDMDWGTKRGVLELYRSTPDPTLLVGRVTGALTRRRIPTLVVWGAGDAYIPARYADEQRQFFEVLGVHVLQGCGHWPFVDDPEGVGALVVPFLRERVEGAGRQQRAGS